MNALSSSPIADIAPIRTPDRAPRYARGSERFELPRDEPVRDRPEIDERRNRGTGYEPVVAETQPRTRSDDRAETPKEEQPSRAGEARADNRTEPRPADATADEAAKGTGSAAGANSGEPGRKAAANEKAGAAGNTSAADTGAADAGGSPAERKTGLAAAMRGAQVVGPEGAAAAGKTAVDAPGAQTPGTATTAAMLDGSAVSEGNSGSQPHDAALTGAGDRNVATATAATVAGEAAALAGAVSTASGPADPSVPSPASPTAGAAAVPSLPATAAGAAGATPKSPTTGEAGGRIGDNESTPTTASAPAQVAGVADTSADGSKPAKAGSGQSQGDAAANAPTARTPDQAAAQLLANAPTADPGAATQAQPSQNGSTTPSFHAEMRAALDAPTQAAAATARAATTFIPAAEQVALQISRAIDQTGDRLTVHLKPAELGKVTIELDVGPDHKVTAVISAERGETLDLLQRDAKALERALNDAGLKTDSGSLAFNLQGQGDYASEGNAESRSHGAAILAGAGNDSAGPEAPAAYRPVIVPDGRVDIQV